MASILIVDDEKSIRKLLRSGLELMGHEIHEGHDGSEAIQIVEEIRPDMVIMDLVMPGMGGLEALPVMKVKHPSLKAILMSGRIVTNSEAFAAVLKQSGSDLFFQKPINIESFLEKVQELLLSKN